MLVLTHKGREGFSIIGAGFFSMWFSFTVTDYGSAIYMCLQTYMVKKGIFENNSQDKDEIKSLVRITGPNFCPLIL